jgi:dihydrofolate reductase
MTAMAKLVYSSIMSLDGYTADAHGNLEWGAPDAEVFTFVNDLERRFGRHLSLRPPDVRGHGLLGDIRRCRRPASLRPGLRRALAGGGQVVYSRTLDVASTARTQIERAFDPGAVLRMKHTAGQDMSIGGPDLAGQAMAAGLIDEMHLFVTPVTLGGRTPALPDHFHSNFELLGVDRFAGGVVHLHYRPSR